MIFFLFQISKIKELKLTNITKKLEKRMSMIFVEGRSDSIYFLFDALLRFSQLSELYYKNNSVFNIYSDIYLK